MWQNTWVIFIRSSLFKKKKKKKGMNVAMWLLYWQGKGAIYSSQMVPAFFFFFKFWNDFSFSSQVLRSLNAFWSWGWPGNLRTYTNAPKIQTTGFYFSLFLSQIPQTVFFLFGFWFAFRSTQTLILVSFSLPPFVLLLFIAHVMSWSPLSFNSRSFGAGISFIQNYRSFCQNLSVYFINKCL